MRKLLTLFIVIFGCLIFNNTTGAQPPTTTAATTQPSDNVLSPEDAAVEAKLSEHLHELRYNAAPLSQVFDDVAAKSGVKIFVDWDALKNAAVTKDSPVTARLRDIKLSKAIELIFKSVQGEDDDHRLGFRISKGRITVTTKPELYKLLVTRSYDVKDLLAVYSDKIPTGVAGGMNAIASDRDTFRDQIRVYITDNVDTNSWKDNGGDYGEISIDKSKNVLIITQTPENQRKVVAVLKDLRDAQATKMHPPTTAP